MPCCEKCWSDTDSPSGDHGEAYRARLAEVHKSGTICTPEEQAGRDAKLCGNCGRLAVHQYAGLCMFCGIRA